MNIFSEFKITPPFEFGQIPDNLESSEEISFKYELNQLQLISNQLQIN